MVKVGISLLCNYNCLPNSPLRSTAFPYPSSDKSRLSITAHIFDEEMSTFNNFRPLCYFGSHPMLPYWKKLWYQCTEKNTPYFPSQGRHRGSATLDDFGVVNCERAPYTTPTVLSMVTFGHMASYLVMHAPIRSSQVQLQPLRLEVYALYASQNPPACQSVALA